MQRAGAFRRLLPRTLYRPPCKHPSGTEAADPGEKRGPGAAERRGGSGLSQTPGCVREGGVRRIYGGEVGRRGSSLSAQ